MKTKQRFRLKGYRNLGPTTSLTIRFFASESEATTYAASHPRPFGRVVITKVA
jgi:hypothetical protein